MCISANRGNYFSEIQTNEYSVLNPNLFWKINDVENTIKQFFFCLFADHTNIWKNSEDFEGLIGKANNIHEKLRNGSKKISIILKKIKTKRFI